MKDAFGILCMKRKVIRMAGSTHVVSLPNDWLKAQHLGKGDDVDLSIQGGMLRIRPNHHTEHVLEADISQLTPFLADRFMARSYQKGYDTIKLTFDHPDILQAVRRKVPELLGYYVTNITDHSCVIQSMRITDLDFETALKRAFLTVREMAYLCRVGYDSADFETLKTVRIRDFNVNKFCYFGLRCINRGVAREEIGKTLLYYHVERLEDAGDELKKLAEELARAPPDHPVLKDLLAYIYEFVDLVCRFFYSPTREDAVRSLEIYGKIVACIDANIKQSDEHTLRFFFTIKSLARILYHYPTMRLDTLPESKK